MISSLFQPVYFEEGRVDHGDGKVPLKHQHHGFGVLEERVEISPVETFLSDELEGLKDQRFPLQLKDLGDLEHRDRCPALPSQEDPFG